MPSEKLNRSYCDFCRIINHDIVASIVFEDDLFIAFLDYRPLIHGHCLVIPKRHIETFNNLPFELILPLFARVQIISQSIEAAVGAEGIFIAINNRVSQSILHFHVHIVPRWHNDGLFSKRDVQEIENIVSDKFIWKRRPYKNIQQRDDIAEKIRKSILKYESPPQ